MNPSDVPTPPGMMDIEMDDPAPTPTPASLGSGHNGMSNPWVGAFRSQHTSAPPQGVPPSLLSFQPTAAQELPRAGATLTAEQQAAKAMRKAQRKAEKAAAREEATGSDAEGDKRFPCPIDGCGKVYKQANGLKYHLTRSINSGHGNLGQAAME
jgi:transcription factor SFP1